MAPWGGSEEKGPACSAFTVYALAHAVIDKDRAHVTVSMPTTHTQKNTHTYKRAHGDVERHTKGPPGLNHIDLEQLH